MQLLVALKLGPSLWQVETPRDQSKEVQRFALADAEYTLATGRAHCFQRNTLLNDHKGYCRAQLETKLQNDKKPKVFPAPLEAVRVPLLHYLGVSWRPPQVPAEPLLPNDVVPV